MLENHLQFHALQYCTVQIYSVSKIENIHGIFIFHTIDYTKQEQSQQLFMKTVQGNNSRSSFT